jgi:hypothetical protein
MFAIEAPSLEDVKRYAAYKEIRDDLQLLDVITVPAQAEEEIISFATDDHHLLHQV